MATPQRRADPVEVAHRGASADEPEHSMAAYRHALRSAQTPWGAMCG